MCREVWNNVYMARMTGKKTLSPLCKQMSMDGGLREQKEIRAGGSSVFVGEESCEQRKIRDQTKGRWGKGDKWQKECRQAGEMD